MGGLFLKGAFSLAVTLATLFVPREKWERRLDSLPGPAERLSSRDLKGWRFRTAVSPATGALHTWLQYPAKDPESAKTLLLLHGINTDGSIFVNLSPLAATHTLIAYNLPEENVLFTGKLQDFTPVIDDFCRTASLDTIDLLGNSLGGIIALSYAARTGTVSIGSCIFASTYIHGARKENVRRIRAMADKLLPYPDYKLLYLLTLGSRLASRMDNDEAGAPAGVLVIKRIAWYREVLASLSVYDGTRDANGISCPVLVLYGNNDRLVAPEEIDVFCKLIPQTRVIRFENAGHALVFSQADTCVAAIRGAGLGF